MQDAHRQVGSAVRFDWGLPGARAHAAGVEVAVVVDVLSFTTAVSVAVDAGTRVWPSREDGAGAAELARRHDAVLAVGRAAARAAGRGQVSLSPASLRARRPPARLVLPSPNGSTVAAALARSVPVVVAACLRNAGAVADWLSTSSGDRTASIAAGERWPGGELRPAVEDLWGAGALVAHLAARGRADLSVEAQSARAAYEAVRGGEQEALLACASGRELVAADYRCDVDIAAEVDTSRAVPVMTGSSFAQPPAP